MLHYVGHSQGTLIALAAFSQWQLLDKVKSAGLLSPVAYLSRITSPLARDAVDNFLSELLYWSGLHQFEPRGQAVTSLLKEICKKPGIECTDLFTSFTGENCCLSTAIVNTFLEHEPQSTATKNMIHLAQMARDGTIAMYDYEDRDKNTQHYGHHAPPEYNLTNIPSDLPLFLAHGGRDDFLMLTMSSSCWTALEPMTLTSSSFSL
uniref:Triacylglycerol lipase n=1 Tax=Opuntia streptacantha TaxID=393608 RepID=A0A7C8ZQD6_OPUST